MTTIKSETIDSSENKFHYIKNPDGNLNMKMPQTELNNYNVTEGFIIRNDISKSEDKYVKCHTNKSRNIKQLNKKNKLLSKTCRRGRVNGAKDILATGKRDCTSTKSLIAKDVNTAKNNNKGVNQYIKKQVLKSLAEKGCSVDTFNKITQNFKVSSNKIKDSINIKIKEAQDFIYQECDSLSFNNIQAWLHYFQEASVDKHCSGELGILMNVIANNELQPWPKDLGGVDLKAIYKFLSNALLGLPYSPIDSISRSFLVHEFESIINEANTDTGDLNTFNMRTHLWNNCNFLPNTSTLNPLQLNINYDNI